MAYEYEGIVIVAVAAATSTAAGEEVS